jgi:DNA gyrase subunit A
MGVKVVTPKAGDAVAVVARSVEAKADDEAEEDDAENGAQEGVEQGVEDGAEVGVEPGVDPGQDVVEADDVLSEDVTIEEPDDTDESES